MEEVARWLRPGSADTLRGPRDRTSSHRGHELRGGQDHRGDRPDRSPRRPWRDGPGVQGRSRLHRPLLPRARLGGLRAVRPPWAANALALAVLCAAAEHPHELTALAQRAAAEREDLTARLQPIPGISLHPSHTNFVLIEVPDGPRLLAALRARAFAVRPAASFPGLSENHIRLTAGDPAANARLAAAIDAIEAMRSERRGE